MKFRILKKPIRFVSMTLAFFTFGGILHVEPINKAATGTDLTAVASRSDSTAPDSPIVPIPHTTYP